MGKKKSHDKPTSPLKPTPRAVRGRGRPQVRDESFVIQARVDRFLFEALEKLVARSRRSKNAELVIALENHAQLHGVWPPPQFDESISREEVED